MFIGYFVVALCALRHFGIQAIVLVTIQEVAMDVIDPEYFDPKDTYILFNDDDEDSVTTRLNIIKPLPETSDGHFAVFGLSMGEFIKPTGMDLDMTLCKMIDAPLVGQFLRKLGLASQACPVQPGIYEGERYRPTVKNSPDEFEENMYQSKFDILVDEKIILSIRAIVDVANV